MAETDITAFQRAAGQVRGRVGLVAMAQWLRASHWIVGLVAIGAVICLRQLQQWRSGEIWVVLGLCTLWLVVGAVRAWIARPTPLSALSHLDRAGDWHDRFASAFSFLKSGSPSLGESLHVSRARADLDTALTQLRQAIPLPPLRLVWILPVLAIAFALSPILRKGLAPGEALLTEEMIQTAGSEAERIRQATRDLDGLTSLDSEEKAAIEELGKDLNAAADEIANPTGDTTTRELLANLESRARAVERMAEELGVSDEAWASEGLIRELSQHADTADLAIGIKDKQPKLVADQATLIADVLKEETLTRETADRYTLALERSMAQASEADHERPVGRHLGTAARLLAARQQVPAAAEFTALASHFQRVDQRQAAQDKLSRLAEQLRESGSQISGSKLESLKQLADAPESRPLPQGLQPVETMPLAQQLQNVMAPQVPQPGGDDQSAMPIPGSLAEQPEGGAGNNPAQSDAPQGLLAPIPGQEPAGDAPGTGLANGGPGNNANPEGGMLSAPIPGSTPGSGGSMPGAGLGGARNGDGTVPGSGGGNEAGSGTMAMYEQEGDLSAAEKEAQVAAQLNEDGESEMRAVESKGTRTETAQRSRRDIAIDFIDTEEAALDAQTLPLSRRNQVLRYFSEIRRQLEETEE